MTLENSHTILAVDDAKDTLMLLEFDLVEAGYQVLTADSGEAALALLASSNIDLVLLDMYMPTMSGLEVLQYIKASTALLKTSVIMLSASEEEDEIVAALEHGADDYVVKPYIAKVLFARIRTSLRLKEKTLQLEALARTDFLTKVYNKGGFEELIVTAISLANRCEQSLTVAMFDIDFFKQVNDSFGHEAGDKALVDFAQLMKASFRDYDILARIGGEEFAVCMPNTEMKDANLACERFRSVVAQHTVNYHGNVTHTFSFTVSIGLVSQKAPTIDYTVLMRGADENLYQAKEQGRNQVVSSDFTENTALTEEEASVTDEQSIVTYPGIDYALGLGNVLGDSALFEEILLMFHQDHCADRDKISQALNTEDQQKVKLLVHTLKGVSSTIGAMILYEHCRELDIVLNQQQASEYWRLFEPLAQELTKVLEGVETQLNDRL